MENSLSPDEIVQIKKVNKKFLIASLSVLLIGIAIVVVSYVIFSTYLPDWFIALSLIPVFLSIMIAVPAPSAFECPRCGEYYKNLPHNQEDCLRNLKNKLALIN